MFMPRSVANSIDKIARQTVGKDWSLYAALLTHWQEIVGPDYAAVTTPSKITFPHQPNQQHRCGGTLFIRLPKGLSMEFSFKTDQIRQRINSYFGYDAIGKIAFEPVYGAPAIKKIQAAELSPEAKSTIEETTKSIEDSELQATLQSFGETLLKQK
jgi:hypothetical protein